MAKRSAAGNRRARIAASFVLAALLLQLVTPAIARAADLTIQTNTATANFPKGINFHLVVGLAQSAKALELRYHPTFSPITQVESPQISPGRHLDVKYALDLTTNYLPPGLDIDYSWRITLADGSTVDTPEQTVFYMDHQRDWHTLTKGPVSLYYYAGNPSFAQDALNTVTDSIDKFDSTFKVTTDQAVQVVMYGSEQDFSNALPLNSDEWIGGFADPELHLIVVGILPGDTSEVHRMLSHEVVHIVMAQATDNPFNEPPTWLNEGLASYYQEVQDDRFGPLLSRAIQDGKLDTIRGLDSSFPSDPDAALLSYAESESIVKFIIQQYGADKMAALIDAFRRGVSYDQAVQQSLGMSLDQLDAAWKQSLGYHGDAQATVRSTEPTDHAGPSISSGRLGGAARDLGGAAAVLLLAGGAIVLTRRRKRAGDPA